MSGPALPGVIEPVALIFKLNNGLVTRSLDGLSDDDVWRRPGTGNPMAWILGHITEARAQLLGTLGEPPALGWSGAFPRGGVLGSPSEYPARPVLEEAWRATHARMRDAFAALTEARLAAPDTGRPLPGAANLAGVVAFYAFHEAYHVGQMGYLRRQLGFSAVAD